MEFIAWPVAVFLFSVFFVILFRRSIHELIGRIREVSRDGIKAGSEHPQKGAVATPPDADKLMRAFDSVVLQQQEEAIQNDLHRKGLTDKSKTIDILVRHLAATQLNLYFEKVNSVIWGSQIHLLQELNSKTLPVPAESLLPFYEIAAKKYPKPYEDYTFEDYLRYLQVNGLVVINEGSDYQITELGSEFLQYLAKTGHTGYRRY